MFTLEKLFAFCLSIMCIACTNTSASAHEDPPVTGRCKVGYVIEALRNVPINNIVCEKDIQSSPLDSDRIPMKSLARAEEAIGRKVKYGLTKGQIVNDSDLYPKLASRVSEPEAAISAAGAAKKQSNSEPKKNRK